MDWLCNRNAYICVVHWEFELFTFNDFFLKLFLGECKNLQDLNLSECQGLNVSTIDFFQEL